MYSGGSTKSAGAACEACESTCEVGSSPTSSASSGGGGGSATTTGSGSSPTGCTAALYEQCGGIGYSGCTACAVSPSSRHSSGSCSLTSHSPEPATFSTTIIRNAHNCSYVDMPFNGCERLDD